MVEVGWCGSPGIRASALSRTTACRRRLHAQRYGGSRSKRAKNAKVILGWRRKGILRVLSPKCGGKWQPYPSPITDEENARILLANLLQGSRSTFSRICFPRFFAFQAGMWDAPISALLNSPTVTARFVRQLTQYLYSQSVVGL